MALTVSSLAVDDPAAGAVGSSRRVADRLRDGRGCAPASAVFADGGLGLRIERGDLLARRSARWLASVAEVGDALAPQLRSARRRSAPPRRVVAASACSRLVERALQVGHLVLRRPDLEEHVGVRRRDAVEVVELRHRVAERLRAHHDVQRARRPVVVDEAQPCREPLLARAARRAARAGARASSVARSLLSRDRGGLEGAQARLGRRRAARRASRGRGRPRAASPRAGVVGRAGLRPWTGRFRTLALRPQPARTRQKQAARSGQQQPPPPLYRPEQGRDRTTVCDLFPHDPPREQTGFGSFVDGCRLPVSEQIANVAHA